MRYTTVRELNLLAATIILLLPGAFAHAATTPSLGAAASFSVLAHTYVNTTISGGTALMGDVGYATTTGVPAFLGGLLHVSDSVFAQAGSGQHAALSALDAQACTFNFTGPVDLSTDSSHGSVGVYQPGVYCSAGTMSVSGTLTLSGAGTFIFRPTGAVVTSDSSHVATSTGASACDIFWTPQGTSSASTNIGSNATFVGTLIEPAGSTNKDVVVGGGTKWSGRALAFDGTVTTNPVILKYIVITPPQCTEPPSVTVTDATTTVPTNEQTATTTPPFTTIDSATTTTTVTTVPTTTPPGAPVTGHGPLGWASILVLAGSLLIAGSGLVVLLRYREPNQAY